MNEKSEIRPSDRRLAEAIEFFKSPNPIATAKQVFKKGQDLWFLADPEHKLEEVVTLAQDQYWVLIVYDGYQKNLWPISPDWITDEQANEWRFEWFTKNRSYQNDEEWREDPTRYLQEEIISLEGSATRRVFTFRATEQLNLTYPGKYGSDSKSEAPAQEPDDYEMFFVGTREGLERDELWKTRNRKVEVKSDFPEGMNEQKAAIAQNAHDLLKTAYETLTGEPWGVSSKEPTNRQAKALAYAFRAGKEAERFGSHDNITIAKSGAPFVFKKAPKGIRETWRRAAWDYMEPIIKSGGKVTARQVAQNLRKYGLADFHDDKWKFGNPELELWKDDREGYLFPWDKKKFDKEVSVIRRDIRKSVRN